MVSDPPDNTSFQADSLKEGNRYLKRGQKVFPCPDPVDISTLPPGNEVITTLSNRDGKLVVSHDSSYVTKLGYRVRRAESEAMNTVAAQKRTTVPLPWVKSTNFSPSEHYASEEYGSIRMSFIRGSTLESKWDTLDQESKEAVCREIWDIVWRLRNIERTDLVGNIYQCAADGTPSKGILEDVQKPARPLMSDEEVRARLYERYLHAGGQVLRDLLPELLPRSDRSVFTHGDIAPWNVMIDDQNKITGILGWKFAGWYPDYWEYAQIMNVPFSDWSGWMERTAAHRWDIDGIDAVKEIVSKT